MPRGREELREHLKRCLERVDRVPDDEPWCGIRFPRVEAKKRVSNEKQSKRIVIVTDPQNFSEFHAMREAYMSYCQDNPTLVALAIINAMKAFDLKGWLEEQADEQHMMGKDLHNAE